MQTLSAEELEEKLSLAVQRLKESLKPAAVYLYGSYAYGTPSRHSDLDLLVIVEDSNLDAYERDAVAYRALCGLGVPKDVQVYTRVEFEERANLPVSFERTVKERGKLVYVAA
jgi:predicted nucleotidyltransferase